MAKKTSKTIKKILSLPTLLLMTAATLAVVYLIQRPTFKITQAESAPPVHQQTIVGTADSGTKVTTSSSVKATSSALYLADISTKPYRPVSSVTGLGLTWKKLKSQCAGRNSTGSEVWMAIGSPSTAGTVTASLSRSAENTVLAVSVYTGVDLANPVTDIYGANTLGLNGACKGGKDTKTYSLNVMTPANSILYGSVGIRLRQHTPGTGINELTEIHYGRDAGDQAGLVAVDRYNQQSGLVKASGTLNSDMDWAAVFFSINGLKAVVPTPSATSTPTTSPTPTASPSPTSVTNPSIVPSTTITLPPQPPLPTSPSVGVWSSPEELKTKPMSGDAWNAVKSAADSLSSSPYPNLDNQDDNTNVQVLAAAIVYARSGEAAYKNKVISALEKIEQFTPQGRTLAWARETGAYAMAADLIGYRTTAFESKMRAMAETYKCSQLNKTLLEMYKQRPNNWGSMAFGSLTAIYRYLGDTARLQEVRDYYIQSIIGPNTSANYGDLSWQCDTSSPRWINRAGCQKTCSGVTVNVDGIIPDDMRRGGSCSATPGSTGYPWEGLQGFVMASRILERAGMPITAVGDRAICRAASVLQDGRFGSGWKASGDDEWQLSFLDKLCGTSWSASYGTGKWGAGKNTGWGYVL